MYRTVVILSVIAVFAALACGDSGERPANGFNAFNDNDANNDSNNNTNDNDNDNNALTCDPESVCQDYCYAKYTRCIGENCDDDPITGHASTELHICMNGLFTTGEDGEQEPFIDGCVDRAAESEEACQQFEADIDDYADQDCDDDEQRRRQCNELKMFLTTEGDAVYDACGCEPASTAEMCTDDDECAVDGEGYCISDNDERECTASCHRYDGVTQPLLPDPGCAPNNGLCLHLDQSYIDGPGGPTSVCQQACTSMDQCPEGASCAPVLQLQDGPLGLCTRGALWDSPFPLCTEPDDCPAGTTCREGTCQPACSGNDTPCDVGGCGDDGYCEVDFQQIF